MNSFLERCRDMHERRARNLLVAAARLEAGHWLDLADMAGQLAADHLERAIELDYTLRGQP